MTQKTRLHTSNNNIIYLSCGEGSGGHSNSGDPYQNKKNIYKIKNIGLREIE